MNYIRRAMPVEAFVFTRDSEITGPKWFGNLLNSEKAYIDRAIIDGQSKVYGCTIRAPACIYKAKLGDYIILDDTGNVCVCKKYRFKKEYEKG